MARKKSLLSKEAKEAQKAAEFQRKQAKRIYKEKVKEMRPFLKRLKKIDLRKDISPSEKGFISKAWNEYQALTNRPTKIYRPKTKKRLKLAQKASQQTGPVKFDVAFVPTINETADVSFKGDKMIVSSKYVDEIKIPFNMKNLVADPEREIRRVLEENPEYSQFVLMAGEYIWNGGISRGLVEKKVLQQLMRYVPGGAGYEKRGPNSHFKNWAFGLRGYKAKNQQDIENFLSAYNEKAKEKKQGKARERRQRRHKFGKKF